MDTQESRFYFTRHLEDRDLDDVQMVLIQIVERALNDTFPTYQSKTDSVRVLDEAIWILIDWTSRTPRGRAQMRKRIQKIIARLANGKLSALPEVKAPEVAELVETVAVWLAAGGDGED